jgi:hypothetical protein
MAWITYKVKETPMTNGDQIKRIHILIEELEIIKKETSRQKFNMHEWCELMKFHTRAALKRAVKGATKNPCGTSACLAGKAALIPRLRKMGFKWDFLKLEDIGYPGENKTQAVAGFIYKERGQWGERFEGDEAVKQFFGLRAYQDVFHNFRIKTLARGIKELKAFVDVEERIFEQFPE